MAERIRHLTTNQVHVGSIPTAPSKEFVGDWQRWLMHSPLKRDQAGSIPASPTKVLRDWQMRLCTRLLSETKQVRFLHPAPCLWHEGRFIQLDQDRAF